MSTLEILRTGPLALVEDLGRPGPRPHGRDAFRGGRPALAHLGQPPGRQPRRPGHRRGDVRRLLGPGARRRCRHRRHGRRRRPVGQWSSLWHQQHSVRPRRAGDLVGGTALRPADYLAVRGGIDVAPVLGSRSYDVMSAIGPLPLQPGDMLAVGEHTDDFPELDQAPVAAIAGDLLELRVVPGPRDDWFADPDALVHTEWVATDRSDRVGMRLTGRPLAHRVETDRQLPSEGATRGAIQVPPNGLPVILGPDHPVTGGYPVIGVVAEGDIDEVAQIRPGQHVRLHWLRDRADRLAADRHTVRLTLVGTRGAHPGPHRTPGSHFRSRRRDPGGRPTHGHRRSAAARSTSPTLTGNTHWGACMP